MPPTVIRRKTGQRVLVVALVVMAFFLLTASTLLQPLEPRTTVPVTIEIPPAATAADVAQLLKEQGLIRSACAFRLLGKFTGQEKMIKAGQYCLAPSETPQDILQTLARGQTVNKEVKVTIPEGYTVRQMARLLAAQGITDETEFLAVAKDGGLLSDYFGDVASSEIDWQWEGFFFPDTYFLLPNTPAEEIAQKMLWRMDEVWAEEIQGLTNLPAGLSPRELITLASLVEREAKVAAERPLIAAVFYNRLHKKMPLQSCATVQYLFPEPKPVLSEEDTKALSPYNTYLHSGLPPGPIAAPGRAAIRAVLRPSNSEKLYFVAKPDGSHAFSITYEEHLENQRKYQTK